MLDFFLQLEIEVAKPAAMPFPPPLDEGVEEGLNMSYIATPPPSPEPEVSFDKSTHHFIGCL